MAGVRYQRRRRNRSHDYQKNRSVKLSLERLEDRRMLSVASELLPLGMKKDDGTARGWVNREVAGIYDFSVFADPSTSGATPLSSPSSQAPAGSTGALVNDPSLDPLTGRFTQSETSMVVFDDNVLVAYNDSGSTVGGANKFTGYSLSTDGGETFTDLGTLPTNAGGDAGDPVLARDEVSGTIYFATLGFSTNNIQIFRSFDGGNTFTTPVTGTPGTSGFQDKPWMTVDNFGGPGQGNVYLLSREFGGGDGIYLFTSTDGGASFGPSGGTLIASGASGNVQGSWVTISPNHDVNVFYLSQQTFPYTIQMRKSTDFGATFGPEITVTTLDTFGTNGNLGLTRSDTNFQSFRSNAFPQVVVNQTNGDLYMTFADNPAGADKADIYLTSSTDGGFTWSSPTRVNTDATDNDQWQPTIAITPDGSQLGVFWYDRRLDANNGLIDYWGRIGNISGSTLDFPEPDFRITENSFEPVFGVDFVVNSSYMSDYDHAQATNAAMYVSWSDNSLGTPDVQFDHIDLGLAVTSSTPANGEIVTTPPASYVVDLSDPYDPTSVEAGDLTVNGIPADLVDTSDPSSLTFTYNTDPVVDQGPYTMEIAEDSITRLDDGDGIAPFTAEFRYDAIRMEVIATNPEIGSIVPLPMTSLEVTFNEAYDPDTAGLDDLILSEGSVVGFDTTISDETVRYLLSGLTNETLLTVDMAAGALTDVYGNPMLAFSADYLIDIAETPYPIPLDPKPPAGSLIYDPSASGEIQYVGDTDTFLLDVDANQTLTVAVTSDPLLRATLEVIDPGGFVLASSTASNSGGTVLVQTAPVSLAGTYEIRVSGGSILEGFSSIFSDTFPDTTFDTTKWDFHFGTTIDDVGINEPSPPYSARFNGQPSGGDELQSIAFDTSANSAVSLTYYYQRTGGGNSTESGEDLVLEYKDANGTWIEVDRQLGSGPDMTTYEEQVVLLPGEAIHSDLQFRFLNSGTPSPSLPFDDWFVDDVDLSVTNDDAVGNYTVQVTLNAALEEESLLGGENDSLLSAQDLDASFVQLAAPFVDRGAVVGQGDPLPEYQATAIDFEFNDISATGTRTLQGVDDSFFSLNLSAQGFEFPFFDNVYNNVFFSTNGLITFGSGNSSFSNTDLTTFPSQASIAPFWDDLVVSTSSPDVGVYYELLGSGDDQQLVLQWNDVRFFGGSFFDPMTFQAILSEDGSIQFNYLDLTNGAFGDEGAGATVGLKDVGPQGPDRLLLSFNQGPNEIVGSGQSTLIARSDPTTDFYSFTLDEGETTTLALAAAVDASVQLLDELGTVLAVGTGAANLTSVINNFVADATGTYFAEVTTLLPGAYDLVVTRNADFDTEFNDSQGGAQDLGASIGALGALTVSEDNVTVPGFLEDAVGNSGNAWPFHIGNFGQPSMRYQQIYSANEFANGGIIDQVRFRLFPNQPAFSTSGIDVRIDLAHAATTVATASPVFADNIGSGQVTVFDGLLDLSASGGSIPNPFEIVIDVDDAFNYLPVEGDLLLDIYMRNSPITAFFETSGFGQQDSTTRIYTFPGDVNADVGRVGFTLSDPRPYGLVTQFDLVPPPVEDWYSFEVSAENPAVRIETSTPADGPGEFVNNLDPKIELYDSTGSLVTSGIVAPDGRNEYIDTGVLDPGQYSIRVLSDNDTIGEYVVDIKSVGANLTDGILEIIGTSLDDDVSINTVGDDRIRVHADFLPDANFEDFYLNEVELIQAWLYEGDDHLTIGGNVEVPALVDGGVGNDFLGGGGGPAVLLGGIGDDTLNGGPGQSILIGGVGSDQIVGGSEEDILIAGTTAYDNNDVALLAILNEWASNVGYDERVENLRSGLDGGIRLEKDLTVFDDADEDILTGGSGRDWFFFDPFNDRVNDQKGDEEGN